MSKQAMTRMYGTPVNVDAVWEDRDAAVEATGGFKHPPVNDGGLYDMLRATQPHVDHCTCRYCEPRVNLDSGDMAGREGDGSGWIWFPIWIIIGALVAYGAA